jgi:hypothetical protein
VSALSVLLATPLGRLDKEGNATETDVDLCRAPITRS